MICVICKKNEAVVHYAEVVEGEIKKLDLCEKCALEKGLGSQVSFSMGDLLGGMTEKMGKEKGTVSCPGCLMALEEFRKIGRLGCDRCYDAFRDALSSMIEQIHRSSLHKGKIPSHFHNNTYIRDNLMKMEKELKEAIQKEDFEKAAYLRDEIRKAKQHLK